MDTTELKKIRLLLVRDIRKAVANYISSEGCSCCRGDSHDKDLKTLAKLLAVKDDNFYPFRSKKKKEL